MDTTIKLTTASPEWQEWADKFLDNSPENLEIPSREDLRFITTIVLDALLNDSEVAQKALEDAVFDGNTRALLIPAKRIESPAKRIESLGYGAEVGISVPVLIGVLADTPGEMVMWAHAATRLAQRSNTGKGVDAGDLLTHFGPGGLPTKARLNALWETQKIDGANMLDMVRAAEPAQV